MKSNAIWSVLLGLSASILFAGCNRPTADKKDGGDSTGINSDIKVTRESSPFQVANEDFKYPNNPRSNDNWTRFPDGLRHLNDHFSKPEVLVRLRLSAKDRDFLTKEVHLNQGELAEVESTAFRTADAYYLDECFLLRDVAHHLEVSGISQLGQANLDFAWTIRNVMLHESTDTWIPPAFIVRRGFGSAVDRALVFLSLLRQSQLEGCLIAVPDTEPLQFLVAVNDPASKSLRLFDTRLGRPVYAKDGKTVATVNEALAAPELLEPSKITAEQAKKFEAWMVCPLYALSPRMLELQKGLRAHDYVTLYMSPEYVRNELAKATTLPIKVWNPIDEKANSPTRALRFLLPKNDGGLDPGNRLMLLNRARVPSQVILTNYAQIRLTPELLPRLMFQLLESLNVDLLGKYDLQTRELYLRGKYEPMLRRQERIQDFANNDSLANLINDEAFQKERSEWQKKINDTFAKLPLETENPAVRNKMLQATMAQATQDPFVGYLLDVDKEDTISDKEAKIDRRDKKTILTRILAVGLRDYLQAEVARTRACTFHEIAVDRQSSLDASAKPSKGFQDRTTNSWFEAKSAWGNSYSDRIALEQMIQQRLKQMQTRVHPSDFDSRVGLLEILHLDTKKYLQARMRLADCLEYTNGKQVSQEMYAKTKSQIETLEKSGLLKAEIDKIGEALPPDARPAFQKRLDLLQRDWTANGSYDWLKRHIDARTGAMRKTAGKS